MKRIRAGDLLDGFTGRDVHRRQWAHLTEREQVAAGLVLLVDVDNLAAMEKTIGPEAAGRKPPT